MNNTNELKPIYKLEDYESLFYPIKSNENRRKMVLNMELPLTLWRGRFLSLLFSKIKGKYMELNSVLPLTVSPELPLYCLLIPWLGSNINSNHYSMASNLGCALILTL